MKPRRAPEAVARAALAFGLDSASVEPLPGASGQTWRVVGGRILRVRARDQLRIELAAAAAAGAVLPVPRVLATADLVGTAAALLEELPGRPAATSTG